MKKLPQHTHVTKETPLRSVKVRAESPSTVIDLDQILDGLFEGTGGLAKFVDEFLTGAKIKLLAIGTGHIQNLAVTNAKIDNLAVTNAKIANLSVDTAKIIDAAIQTAKIADAAITNAKIENAAITNLKILSGTIEFNKCDSEFGKYSHFQHGKWITSIEALTGYQVDYTGTGYHNVRKNYFEIGTGEQAGSYMRVYSYPTIDIAHDPIIKCKVEITSFIDENLAWIKFGCGQVWTSSQKYFGFALRRVNETATICGIWCDGTNAYFVGLQTVSIGNKPVLEARLTAGSQIEFYVNGTLKYTATVDIPSSGMIDDFGCEAWNYNQTSDYKITVYNYSVQEDWM